MKAASYLALACVTKVTCKLVTMPGGYVSLDMQMSKKLIDVYDGDIITQLLSLVWER